MHARINNLAAGDYHSFIICADERRSPVKGKLLGFGLGAGGRLSLRGHDADEGHSTPRPLMAFHGEKVRRQFLEMLIFSHNPSQAAKHVEAGPDYTIVITKRGEIYACGQNAYGQVSFYFSYSV